MSEICPRCGLPKEICVCSVLDKEVATKIKVFTQKAKFNKFVTVIAGIGSDQIEDATKNLKKMLACGGTYKDSTIELQGKHLNEVKGALVKMGFKGDNIDVG